MSHPLRGIREPSRTSEIGKKKAMKRRRSMQDGKHPAVSQGRPSYQSAFKAKGKGVGKGGNNMEVGYFC